MSQRFFKVIIERDEDGYFVVSVPSLPGCHTQGKTLEKAIKRAKEAIELYLETNGIKLTEDIPQPSFIGVEEVLVQHAQAISD